MKTDFFTKDGFHSNYAFSCGYIEKYENDYISVKMYKEHNCFHCIIFDKTKKIRIDWQSFDTLTKCKRFYLKIRSKIKRIEKKTKEIDRLLK